MQGCRAPVTSSHITTHNRITTDCHTTQDTHDTTHTHTQINLGDACLATLNAKQAVPSELGSSGERSAPSPGSTQLPTAAKTLLYSKWLPAEKGHNSGKRLTCPAAQAKRLAIAGPQQTAGGSWLIQKKSKHNHDRCDKHVGLPHAQTVRTFMYNTDI